MLDYILELTQRILGEAKKLTPEEKDFIFDQVSYAIRQTQAHINGTRKDHQDKASSVLSNIWQRVGSRIKTSKHPAVRSLAKTLEEKSKYWADPDSYPEDLLNDYKMKLTQVQEVIDEL